MAEFQDFVAIKKSPHDHLWMIVDHNDKLIGYTGSKVKAQGVVEFLRDAATPFREGVVDWIERNRPAKGAANG